MDINLNNLKYFYEVIECGNITKASEKLYVTQPNITRAIKNIEKELNVTLIKRNKRGVVPTEEGIVLYEYAKNMFNTLGSTINVIKEVKEDAHLFIGATTTNFLEEIITPLKKFKEIHPNVKVEIVLDELNVLEKYNKLGKLDIVIKNNYEYIDDFEKIKEFNIKDVFIASKKDFSSLENKTLSLEEILKYPFVLLSKITHGRRNFDAYLKAKNIYFKPEYEFNSYSLCRKLIEEGFGIGIGNPIHYQSEKFIILKTDFKIPERSFDIGYIKDSKNKYIEDFLKLIK